MEPTAERLRALFGYDPVTGILTWRETHGRMVAGSRAGSDHPLGYRRVCVDRENFLEHRIIWTMMNGSPPAHQIDHANGVRDDNRLQNLREATVAENAHNRAKPRSSRGTLKGAHYSTTRRRWQSSIKTGNRQVFLGRFDTEEEAHEAYVRAAILHHGKFARAA